ncbi:family 78 glycoside hydrolase catalytic domain [Pelagicoccus sp. NFK12]|uniref:alpha-L-rhamnosidase n=1 Tax=Pelagicoccus enzymogenes TaxID=2773457 RepID=A0A927IHC9_9BACT|nr:family 78 glycoside hydrolase catalytic domain [Pelagicoccus enzymogenes]MBD5780046.1 family 78 glycoside hydrolase catalytic domain [Pelagicoccus enzymogenes]
MRTPVSYLASLLVFLTHALCCLAEGNPLQVGKLKSEHLVNPIQLDAREPRLSWMLTTTDPADRDRSQSAYRILVSGSIQELDKGNGDLWDSGKVESGRSHLVPYAGVELVSRQKCYWKVKVWDESERESGWSPVAEWTMALLDVNDWNGSEWIGLEEDNRESALAEREYAFQKEPEMKRSYPSPLLRRQISIEKPVRRALAYVAGVGYSEFYLNGEKVGDAVLDPGQTNYETHTLYVTHDVSYLLKQGDNALGIWLGSGFFGQNVAWKQDFDYGQPRARAILYVEYEDGSVESFGTDGNWKATTSPIVFDNVYWGETYDARLEIPDWASAGYDDSSWQDAVLLSAPCPTDRLRSQLIEPIRVQRRIKPVGVKDIGGGKYVVDFGENLAGWVEIVVDQDPGDVITMVAGEVMEPDGITVNTGTSGGAPGRIQEMIYVAKGGGEERWKARFSYHGFQFVEVSGLSAPPHPDTITAELVFSDLKKAGSFECSEDLMNQQWEITRRTLEANWHSIPEDCPAREKCGWLGDAHATSDVSFYGYDMTVFLAKFLRDIEDSLKKDKRYEEVVGKGRGVPTFVAPGKRVTDHPAEIDWAVAYLLVAWDVYLHSGDTVVFDRHFGHFKNFVSYFESMRGPGNILPSGLGDWCPPLWDRKGAPEYMLCHPHVSGTAFYYEALRIVSEIAFLKGEDRYADYCRALAADVKDAFNANYLEVIEGTDARFYGSQTATVMALKFGMVPDGMVPSVVDGLVFDIEKVHEGHHAVGIHGLRHLYTVLSDFGQDELVARMLLDRGFPGPGYLADHGFSTWPERQFNWGEEPRYRNSMNHPMQGGFAAFFFEGIGGIRPLSSAGGYKGFELRPRLMGEIDWATTTKESPYGVIESDWKREGDRIFWQVSIPVNTQAEVYLPTPDVGSVLESGAQLEGVPGVKDLAVVSDGLKESVKLTLGSGRYFFEMIDSDWQ